jgi:histidinol dehydrogenase
MSWMLERLAVVAADVEEVAGQVRGFVPEPAAIAEVVAGIVASVREGGDKALLEHERRFGGGAPLRVGDDELAAALDALDPAVREGLELARANVGRVAEVGLSADVDVELPQGHRVRVRELPVRRAAVYAPGGRQPYPSSVIMGAVTARAAGVPELVVAAPAHPVILAACALCGADEVYRMGGAQAIAALAWGTESVPRVDVIVGPGNLYVQEAKRQLSGRVGIDGFAGPSDLLVIASAGADPRLVALDLLAQAEHGVDSLVVAISDDSAVLDAVGREAQALFGARRTIAGGPKVLLAADTLETALAFSEALAPEHLELVGEAAEALAPRVTRAGCLFVGAASATAFGDYVAGSNHTLPTDGAARFASGLSVAHFRRRMNEVRVGDAATALARAGIPIAEAEGFAVHAESMSARIPPA